ncbi:MAG: tetratricopeptide repeat protein [Proteobacteria bacterium]|nr:tetratricopeptide repeat protein [Pseudomonadota bacterium]
MTSLHKFLLALGVAMVFALPALGQEVSQEAKRHMFRGQAAMEEASDASGYQDAVSEFKQAIQLAPNWADAWFNLGVAQEKVGDLSGAMKSFQKYLDLNPNASDRNEVEALIYKLEYLIDKAQRQTALKKAQAQNDASLANGLEGLWENSLIPARYKIYMKKGNEFEIRMIAFCPFGDCSKGYKSINQLNFVGEVVDGQIKGFSFMDAPIESGARKQCYYPRGYHPGVGKLSSDKNRLEITTMLIDENENCPDLPSTLKLHRKN